jgi:hypothetical protein
VEPAGSQPIPARDRVRLSCALGALLSSLMTVSDLGDISIETYGDLLSASLLAAERRLVARSGWSIRLFVDEGLGFG